MAWIGDGSYNSFGYYQLPMPCIKQPNLTPCHQIFNRGPAGGSEQFWVIPIDQNGHEIGPPAYKTAGQVMYSNWESAYQDPNSFISDKYIP